MIMRPLKASDEVLPLNIDENMENGHYRRGESRKFVRVLRGVATSGRNVRLAVIAVAALLISLLLSYLVYGHTFYFLLRSDGAVQKRMHSHDRAIVEGMAYLHSIPRHKLVTWSSNSTFNHQFCLVIATRQRKVPYVQVLMASLLMANDAEMIASTSIYIFNSESPPENNLDLALIRQSLPFVQIHNAYNATQQPTWSKKYNTNRNYAQMLDLCLQEDRHADWVIVLEDDTMVTQDFLSKSAKLLRGYEDAAFVKLFVSDRWDGFETKNVPILVVYCAILSLVVTLLGFWILRQVCACRRILNRQDNVRSSILCPLAFLWITLIVSVNFFLVGRQNWIMLHNHLLYGNQNYRVVPLGRYHRAHGQAMAYSRQGAIQARDYLSSFLPHSKIPAFFDVLLTREFLQQTGLRAYEVQPPLIQHLGVYSSFLGKNNGDFGILGQNEAFREGVFGDFYPNEGVGWV